MRFSEFLINEQAPGEYIPRPGSQESVTRKAEEIGSQFYRSARKIASDAGKPSDSETIRKLANTLATRFASNVLRAIDTEAKRSIQRPAI